MTKNKTLSEVIASFQQQLNLSELPAKLPREEFKVFDEAQIGASIKEKRKSLGLSEKALSELSGVSRSTIQRVENGSTDVNFNSLYKIMKALGLELAWK